MWGAIRRVAGLMLIGRFRMTLADPQSHIRVEASPRRVRARFGDHIIADTTDAILLYEGGRTPVVYFPRQDVEMGFMGRTKRSTHCPFKGDASYYTLTIDGKVVENVLWSYETPLPGMEAIGERVAFYPDKVEIYQPDA